VHSPLENKVYILNSTKTGFSVSILIVVENNGERNAPRQVCLEFCPVVWQFRLGDDESVPYEQVATHSAFIKSLTDACPSTSFLLPSYTVRGY
jgi:hypothetical protein